METQENIKTKSDVDKSHIRDWNGWDLFFSIALIAYIILVPLSGTYYLDGRFGTYSALLDTCFMEILIIVFLLVNTVEFIIYFNKYTKRKRIIKILHISIPVAYIASFVITIFTHVNIYPGVPGYKAFTYGFRDRIRSEADIENIRDWLKTLKKEDCTGKTINMFPVQEPLNSNLPDSIELPTSLKAFNPRYVNLDLDENGNPKVKVTWGSMRTGQWGFVIGNEEMTIPPSDFSEYNKYRLPIESGAYVLYEWQ